MEIYSQSGSEWNIWDLHVHSPASFGGNDYAAFIKNLAASEAMAIGINDYCTLEGYKKVVELGGVPGKIIFPVIEFRMNNIVANRKGSSPASGGTKINFHLIFSNEPSLFGTIENWLNSVSCFNASGGDAQLGAVPTEHLMKITFDFREILRSLKEYNLREHCIVWLPYDEYGGIDDIDPDDNFFKLHLIRNADTLGSSRQKQIDFFKWRDPKFKEEHYKEYMDAPKPCIKGSDAHELNYPFGKLRNDKSEPMERYCWVKANLSFNGLKQIIYEPDRVYIGKEPELLVRKKAHPHKFIKRLYIDKETGSRTSEIWFQNFDLPFNAGLIAVIGKKGNGKSAVADIIGLCANSRNNKDDLSFLHRDKFKNPRANKSKDFKASIAWVDGTASVETNLNSDINIHQEERVKYIPQNYLEKLCVSEEQKEFEEELKKIIFAHIPASERLGQNSLDDLIRLKQKGIEDGIAQKRLEISKINKQVARLEEKVKVSYKIIITQELSNKQTELKHHNENKPAEKPKPDEDENQRSVNREILGQVETKQAELKLLLDQKQLLDAELSSNNISINELELAKNEITHLGNTIGKTISDKRPLLEKYSIDVKTIINYSIDLTKLTTKIDDFKARNLQIGLSIQGDLQTIGLTQQTAGLVVSLSELQGQLALSQKEYQEYLQNKDIWERRMLEIIGTPELVGSLEYFSAELKYIDQQLKKDMAAIRADRMNLTREVFTLKKQLLSIYSTLYQPVTEVLQKESSFVEEYNIKVNASLVVRGFADRFISFINQKSRGTFAGTTEGREFLDQMIAMHRVNDVLELDLYLSDIMGALQHDKRPGYNNESRNPDEQLKRDIRLEDLYDFIFGLEYIEPQFKLQLGSKELKELSPGERGAILLIFYLFLDIDNKPLIIDQPEENLDNESIYYYLVHFIKRAKQKRQIILITHNPNLAVVCDAEQIIHMVIDKQNFNKVSFIAGAIENPDIARRVINILEGTKPAFDNRRLKYTSIVS